MDAQTEAALRLAYNALAAAEWAGRDREEHAYCPSCLNYRRYHSRTHQDDCELANALAVIRALLPDVEGR